MTDQRTTQERADAQLRAWLDAEAESPAPTRVFEEVFATTRTMSQVRRWPTWWPFASDRVGGLDAVSTRRLLLLVALGLAALGAVVIASGGRPFLSLVRPAPTSEARTAERFAQACAHPLQISVVGGDVWVSCVDQVRWFDRSGRVQGAESGTALGVDATGGWLATGDRVASVDAMGRLGPLLTVPNITAIALDRGSAWAMDATDDRVVRVDRATNAVIATIPLSSRPSAIVASDGKVWLILPDLGRIAVVDPASNSVTDLVAVAHPVAITTAFGAIWVASDIPVALTRIDPATLRTATAAIAALGVSSAQPTPAPAPNRVSVADVGGSLWVAAASEVVEVDPNTIAAARVVDVLAPDPVPIGGIAGLDGQLLLIDMGNDRVLSLSP